MNSTASTFKENKKILLVLLPYWTGLIPPLGISCLKSYLRGHGYEVKTADANIERRFRDIYATYFAELKQMIPPKKQGNFYNIGNDVLRNHMMAHMNRSSAGVGNRQACEEKGAYTEVVKELVFRTFFTAVSAGQVERLDTLIADFYNALETYMAELLDTEQPDVLGVSVYNGTLPASMYAFRMAKQRRPRMLTVMGGGVFADQLSPGPSHAAGSACDVGSPNFDAFLDAAPYIDKIIVGEGEQMFLKLLRGELPEDQRVFRLQDIGFELLNLETVDVPDFSDFNANSYPCMASYVSRSCPFQCSFCSETVQWGKYRRKPAGQVATELWKLYETHGTQLFLMGDSLLNPVVKELSQVLYDQGKVIYWDGYLRADRPVCDPENTFQWRRGGFYRARLGVESGSENILKAMGKGIGPGQIKEAVSSLASAGIKTTTYWVIGHPGETEEDFQQTLDLLADLKDDIYEADCNPFNFYYSGQVLSEQWKKKSRLLYSQCASEMLVARTWTLDLDPRREVIYERISRFMAQCRALGIPNPYTLKDIYEADQRWLRLQKNAVPPVSEFGKGYMEECRQVQKLLESSTIDHDDDWGF